MVNCKNNVTSILLLCRICILTVWNKNFSCNFTYRFDYEEASEKESTLPFDQLQLQQTIAHLIKNYQRPIIALTNGVTIGAGTVLSIHCKHCIATENTSFAMPECSIGLIPDAGASYIFPRLPGRLGWYLALTGERLSGSDMCHVGLATHFCKSKNLLKLEDNLLTSNGDIEQVLNNFSLKELPEFSLSSLLSKINYYFAAETVDEMIIRIEHDSSDWARNTLRKMLSKSPTSLKIAHKEMILGKNMNFSACLKMEYILNCQRIEDNDFYEGLFIK